MNRYLDKVPTLALLTLGGLSREELLSLPDVTAEDVDKACKLLYEKGFSIGSCERCKQIAWISKVQWETDDGQLEAKLCIKCEKICQEPRKTKRLISNVRPHKRARAHTHTIPK